MKKLLLFTLAAILILSSCAPAATQTQEAKKDRLVIAAPQDPDFLDPHQAVAAGTKEMMFNVFEGLLKARPDGSLADALAESHTISEDGLTYSFVIRSNVSFHNGKIMTPEDVLFSYQRLQKYSEAMKDVKIILNENKIVFTLPEANQAFLEEMTKAVLNKDVSEEDQNKSPVGTGPYAFVSYEPTQSLKFTRFDKYWNKEVKPQVKDVEFRIFSDLNAGLTSFLAGEVDILPRISVDQLARIGSAGYSVESPQNLIQFLGFNHQDKILSDPKVRQALTYGLDRKEIISRVAENKGTPIASNMSPVMKFWYLDGLDQTYPFNVEKAKELLSQAGYPNGFELEITVPSNYDFHVKTAEVLVEQLARIGVKGIIKQVEWNTWLKDVYTDRKFQSTVIAFDGKLDPHSMLIYYLSDSSKNFFNYNNPKFDTLMKEGLKVTDQNARTEIYKQAQKELALDPPAYYIMDPNYIVALKNNIKGWTFYPIYVQDISLLYFE